MKIKHNTPSNKIIVNGRTIYLSKFHSLDSARRFGTNGTKPSWIIMGDHDDPWGGYWSCRPVDAVRLENAGYELVR
jgi:hypothetical protein